jgi:hypothetical protein
MDSDKDRHRGSRQLVHIRIPNLLNIGHISLPCPFVSLCLKSEEPPNTVPVCIKKREFITKSSKNDERKRYVIESVSIKKADTCKNLK